MTSKSESTHARNAGNLERLKDFCASYVPSFNPGNARLSIASLTAQHQQAVAAIRSSDSAENSWGLAVDQRQNLFKGLSKFCTALERSVKSADAPAKVIEGLASLTRRIKGAKLQKPKSPDVEEPTGVDPKDPAKKKISTSQLSFDSMTSNFSQVVDFIAKIEQTFFTPSEQEFSSVGLTTRLSSMQNANTAVSNADSALRAARRVRNNILYGPVTGVYDTAAAVKNYVRSIFPGGPQVAEVNSLKFTKPKKKK